MLLRAAEGGVAIPAWLETAPSGYALLAVTLGVDTRDPEAGRRFMDVSYTKPFS